MSSSLQALTDSLTFKLAELRTCRVHIVKDHRFDIPLISSCESFSVRSQAGRLTAVVVELETKWLPRACRLLASLSLIHDDLSSSVKEPGRNTLVVMLWVDPTYPYSFFFTDRLAESNLMGPKRRSEQSGAGNSRSRVPVGRLNTSSGCLVTV